MVSKTKYRVGAVQMSCSPDPDANLDKAADRVREAARGGANIVCLPELFGAQYFCQREDAELVDLAEPIPGPSTERLSAVAREEKVVVVASLFERRAPGLYHNTVALLQSDGSLGGIYRKMRIPALRGANVIFYPTAIGWHPAEKERFGSAQYEAWQTIQRSHAIANGVYVASVNRVGHEHGDVRGNRAPGAGLEFWGGSFIADPFGRVLAQAPHHEEAILIEEVDLKNLEDTRRNWPFLRDRRIFFYPPITVRFLDDGK